MKKKLRKLYKLRTSNYDDWLHNRVPVGYNPEKEEKHITLTFSTGEQIEFVELGETILCDDPNFYVILKSMQDYEEIKKDSKLVFKVIGEEKGRTNLEIVEDEKIVENILERY